jgi:AcrR family transcriptional regulator
MFASRGFDAVKVSEIADRVNVSMKTLYNYFPTKESMVLDDADELIESLATALRDRQAGMSITDAFVRALEANMYGFDLLDDELAAYVATTFAAMVKQTPALHAHWRRTPSRGTAGDRTGIAQPRHPDRRAQRPGITPGLGGHRLTRARRSSAGRCRKRRESRPSKTRTKHATWPGNDS